MGLNLTYSEGDVPGAAEIERLRLRAERAGMRLLPKSHPATYWPGPGSSLSAGNLDHVVASEHLRITGDYVQVRGWVDRKTDRGRDGWVRKNSDHGMLWVGVG